MADVLEEAARVLEDVGWIQFEQAKFDVPGTVFGSGDARQVVGVCLNGGCVVAVNKLSGHAALPYFTQGTAAYLERTVLFDKVNRAVRNALGQQPHNWNDMPGRTAQEVIDKIREIAKDLRNNATPGGES